MEQLPRLRARIASLTELRDLMRAMRAMAASHVQDAQAAVTGIRRYVEIVEAGIAEAVALVPDDPGGAFPRAASPANGALIVVCSEHGFVGALNDALLDRAAADLAEGQQLGIIGQRGAMMADERNMDVAWRFPMATHVGGVLGVTRQVADRLAAVATADIVFGRYRVGGNYEVVSRTILPLDPDILIASGPQRGPPLHHLEPAVLLQQLAAEYLFAEITRAVMESLASENGARLHLLSAADRNIGDKLEGLHRDENSLRQELITSELLDVVTGAEAIMGQAW